MMNSSIFEKIGGRRMFLTLLTICLATALCAYGKLDATNWFLAVSAALGFYNFANTYQKKVEADHNDRLGGV
jgi:hypothetical protein